MEKTNKMKSLTNDMKTFEKLMQEQRKEKQIPEIELEIDTEEDSPADILLQAAGMLMDCSVMVAKAAFLVGLMEAETDEDDEDECDNCPYSGNCGSTYGTMVLVARPDGDNTIMTMDELAEEIGDIFAGRPRSSGISLPDRPGPMICIRSRTPRISTTPLRRKSP